MVDEQHLLDPRAHSGHHLHLPVLVEEVVGAGKELPDVKHGVLDLLQVVHPTQGVTQKVGPDQVPEAGGEPRHDPGLALVTDVCAADVETPQVVTGDDQGHCLILCTPKSYNVSVTSSSKDAYLKKIAVFNIKNSEPFRASFYKRLQNFNVTILLQ